jgi:ABC-type antimicrobial peptide transport system permease subunit
MPYLLAATLSVLGAAALVQALAASVVDRRRDFAVLRALGAVRGQLRAVVNALMPAHPNTCDGIPRVVP